MNRQQLAKNVGRTVRLRPPATTCQDKKLDDDWIILDVTDTRARLQHVASNAPLTLGLDHIRKFSSDPERDAEPNAPYGFLVLTENVVREDDGRFRVEPSVPGAGRVRGGPAPPRLSGADCAQLGEFINQMDAALKKLVRERASDPVRAEVAALQNNVRDWLSAPARVGPAVASSFSAAPPDLTTPHGFPAAYSGIYQRMCGRLTFLIRFAQRVC